MAGHSADLLRVRHLSKRYRRIVALEDVSFSVRAGEVLGIIGPNGAGKTTLLECLAGLTTGDAGAVESSSAPVPPSQRTSHLFYLPDAIAPWPTSSVRWALGFAAGFLGGDTATIPTVIRDFDLDPILDQPIGTLSKGQRKRALMGVALVAPQRIVMCDEPFDGLDLRQTRETGAALRRHAEAGRTLVLSIHQIADAARVCDRFVLLSAGRVCGEGTLAELTSAAGRQTSSADLEEVFLALT